MSDLSEWFRLRQPLRCAEPCDLPPCKCAEDDAAALVAFIAEGMPDAPVSLTAVRIHSDVVHDKVDPMVRFVTADDCARYAAAAVVRARGER